MLSQIQAIRRRCGADPKADAVSGNELATFLLGYPTMGGVDRNIDPAFSNFYWAVFLQDDWKVAPRLTVNWGLRWDYEAPGFERYDRMVRGFDFDAPSPIAGAASGLNLRGAVTFARLNGAPRGVFEPDRNNFQPRIGAAYQLGQKWVIRAGYGLYYLGQNEPGSVQGFSQRTPIISTTDNLTPLITLSDPFANYSNGRLLDPIGASHRPLPYSHQYSFDIERELPGGLLAEAAYVGNATRKLPLNVQANFLPATELGRRMATGAIDTAYYTGRVPNPLEGLIPDNAALNGATIPRQQLLLPYPHYTGIMLNSVPIGRQRYHGFQSRLTRRFSRGVSFLASYAFGKTLEQVTLLNQQDFVLADAQSTHLEKRPADEIDLPQKFTVAYVWELPFGRGKALGGSWNRAMELAAGGWKINGNITYQSGWAVPYPNAAQVTPGSAKLSGRERTIDRWFNTSLWTNPATGRPVSAPEPFTLRTFPTLFSDVRVPGYQNGDISASKYFPIYEQLRLQFRFEMVNAFNRPWLTGLIGGGNDVTNANFGRLNFVQGNLPRFLKLGLHLYW